MSDLREKAIEAFCAADGGTRYLDSTTCEAIEAVIAVCMEEAAKVAESYAEQTDYDIEPEAAVAENVTARLIAAALRALRGGMDG